MKARLFWMTLLGILFSQDVDAKSTLQEFIRNQAEALVAGRTVMLAQEMLHCETLLPKYYQRRGFEPAWNARDSHVVRCMFLYSNTVRMHLAPLPVVFLHFQYRIPAYAGFVRKVNLGAQRTYGFKFRRYRGRFDL